MWSEKKENKKEEEEEEEKKEKWPNLRNNNRFQAGG